MHRITGNGGQDSLIEMSPTDSYNGELVNSARFVVKLRIRRGVLWPRSPPLFFCHLDKRRPWGGMQGGGGGITTWTENLGEPLSRQETEIHQGNSSMHKGEDTLRRYSCIVFSYEIEMMITGHVFCWDILPFFPVTFVIKIKS